jgi:hypothetical protein
VLIASLVLVSMDERTSIENLRCAHLKVLLDQGLGVEIASLVLVSMEERTSMENRLSGNRLRCLNLKSFLVKALQFFYENVLVWEIWYIS